MAVSCSALSAFNPGECMPVLREASLGRFIHPTHIGVTRQGRQLYTLQRVDHPDADPIQAGAPALGWEGDSRLQLYVNPAENRWVLMRLENFSEYHAVIDSERGQRLNGEFVNELIRYLQLHDQHRGFDVVKALDAHEAKREADLDAAHDDFVKNDLVPAMQWAAERGHGERSVFPVNEIKKELPADG